MATSQSFDVVVVGAGSAGAAAARHLARRGYRVALVERRPRSEAGARWVNAVPPWMFDRAAVPQPAGDEVRTHGDRYVLSDWRGEHRVNLPGSPTVAVDMRLLIARLQEEAQGAGAAVFDQVTVDGVRPQGSGRAVRLRRGDGTAVELEGRLIIDASGLGGAVRRRVPELARLCPSPDGHHICSAAQEVRSIVDRAGARAFLDRYGLRSRDAIGFVGVAGGYSTRVVQVDLERGEVDLLTGAVAGEGRPSGARLIEEFVAAQPWIGPRIFGGAGAIPLRRPYSTLGLPGVVLLGDAACLVFPAHGSGVGAGLVAARLLADAVTAAGDPASPAVPRQYAAAIHRDLGALFSAYDAFRRMSQRLEGDDVGALIRAGFVNESTTHSGLLQVMPRFSPRHALRLGRAAVREPRLAAAMAPTLARMFAAYALSRQFPESPALGQFLGRGIDRLLGD